MNKTAKKRWRVAPYIRRARQRFLEGTWHRVPADAVQAGVKSFEHWLEILAEERALDLQARSNRSGAKPEGRLTPVQERADSNTSG